ncbi:MAG: phosphoribosylglycinamide formyltransferase, phosphoribosylglycinamide formyltransferase 1 [Parcubacteria group bacterium]|nr:phosphoribosylglycinamide formyltransferase, phosphoribosylglycinamide formyltransferase 1 [Parcubacteria group bacterium]
MRAKLLICASGTPRGGGTGFENYALAAKRDELNADIVGVVSNHENGGVRERADRLCIRFSYLSKNLCTAKEYRALVDYFKPDFVALSGWMLKTSGLDPRTTFNIHPGPLPEFGGHKMYGDRVHAAVLAAYRRGEITHSAVSMHFVDSEYDTGPLFFRHPVPIEPNDTVETLRARVNREEHFWQPQITNMVLEGDVRWDGTDPASLIGSMV